MSLREQFIQAADENIEQTSGNKTISGSVHVYDRNRQHAESFFNNPEQLKKRAHAIKWKTMENLDRYLLEFEANFTRKGGKVIWANTTDEANTEILRILNRNQARTVVKSKTSTYEELGLHDFFEKNHILCQETDLGEYILSLRNERPRHLVTPAAHLSKEDIAALFNQRLGTSPDASPEELTAKVRTELRDQYLRADAGITGANFLIADQGSVVITENEGNARLCSTFPDIHIVIAGIEKIIPALTDLDIFLPLLSSSGTGQQLTAYNSVISPRQPSDTDGPKEMYVILLDNGRTTLLGPKDQRQSLYCIRCAACLNVCPVYAMAGGSAYQSSYTGPIGSIIEPHLKGMEDFAWLSDASTLCGKCTEVCPVKIDLHHLLIYNRRDSINKSLASRQEMWGWYFWTRIMMNARLLNLFGLKLKKKLLQKFLENKWGPKRSLPEPEKQSFRKQN